MIDKQKPPQPPELGEYAQNRPNFPPEQLLPYAGQYVAWSADGTQILASGETMDAVEEKVIAMGIHPNQVVGGYIPPPDVVLF